jgi:predicted MFS family arabinose efflux permease
MNPRSVVLIVAAVQCVNILDFMMVMPLGPDFAVALGIPTSQIGVLGGAYTFAAALAGIFGAGVLDRFDRRRALALAMLGLALSTALGGLSIGMGSLIGARLLAGAFGGPATAVALAIIADTVPPAERGKAMGTVMSAFSVAAILGVPAGLRVAQWLGWRAPFFGVGLLGMLLALVAYRALPSLRSHLDSPATRGAASRGLTFDRLTRAALANTAIVMLGVFAVVPNISTYLQKNIGYPRERLDAIYFVGGLASFFANRVVGRLVDRFGATRLVVAGTSIYAFVLYFGFIDPVGVAHVIYLFPLIMLSATVRGVPINTLASRVPAPAERARFMSALNATQHLASSAGALGASLLLSADATGRLSGMDHAAMAAIGVSFFVPFVSLFIERGVLAKERAGGLATTAPASPAHEVSIAATQRR